ncbi:hypothetical protein [Actinoplanes aureus]|uniref:Uncharacterized protein n=1 Tax=Actinoplanes aureus TaxID=2792083 RepID=A0A931CFN2_9ACTN|nr:hypothetical protein [Actinoplanes aureus]MBG0569259.1 hypothetical protein [Actinoplanes aureus]
MQSVRGVRLEPFKTGHHADLRRQPYQIGAVQDQVLDLRQLADGERQGDDLSAFCCAQLDEGLEHGPAIGCRLINQCEQMQPSRAFGVLPVGVELHVRRTSRGRIPNASATIPVKPTGRRPDSISEPVGEDTWLILRSAHGCTAYPAPGSASIFSRPSSRGP